MPIKFSFIDSFDTHDKESVTRPTKKNRSMALYVKNPKTCRNKKHSAAFLTPPDSSLSSSSGSLSSSTNSERKHHPKRKTLRYKGHTTLIASIPRRKKQKTKKSSGSDSDGPVPLRNNNSPDELNRNSLFSSCKSSFVFAFRVRWRNLARVTRLRPRECRCSFPVVQKSLLRRDCRRPDTI